MTRYIFPIIIAFTLLFTSCLDEIDYEPIGEGNSSITATIKFHPLISSLEDNKSRTEGDAIKTIRNIQVVIYNAKNDELIRVEKFVEGDKENKGEFTKGENDKMPDKINGTEKPYDQSEAMTETATFTLASLPFGRYKIYAVANYSDLTAEGIDISTPDKLKSLKAEWDQNKISNNDQMFGYFATDDQSGYEDAPILTINRKSASLNAWILRLASKVTIVYDGHDLYEGINIYIKSVSIKDIPSTCTLGFIPTEELTKRKVNGNCPSEDQLITNPANSTLYYKTKTQGGNDDDLDEVETLEEDPNVNYKEWLCVNRSVSAIGAVQTTRDGNNNLKYDLDENNEKITHTEKMPALFFYENCQGNYEDYPDKKLYDKTPAEDDVYTDENDDNVYKDRVKAGTFIEVKGFYVSNNPQNQSNGEITYRFMLGQNTEYDYNALRNRHYKLTLKFRGYANQPEWHIVYDEDNPGLFPPEDYFMSYLYNVRQEMPIRLTGHPTKVIVQIVENCWAPYDSEEEEMVAPAGPTLAEDPTAFRWNRVVYTGNEYSYGLHSFYNGGSTPYTSDIINGSSNPEENIPEGMIYENNKVSPIWVGFLALQAPTGFEDFNTPLPTGVYDTRSVDNYSDSRTMEGMRRFFYGTENAQFRDSDRPINMIPLYENTYILPDLNELTSDFVTYNSGEKNDRTGRNAYSAKKNPDGAYSINIPMFTLPKDIGYISGFSGNNPYEAYYRKAVLKITAVFNESSGEKTLIKYMPIFQMRRIINPKAVWRTWDDNEAFEVRLMVLDRPNDTQFVNLESNGEWEAYVAEEGNDQRPATNQVFTLEGAGSDGKVHGSTGSKIRFKILFDGDVPQNETRCGKVLVHYHGNNCEHSIFVRKGYNVPVRIGNDKEDAEWSSFAVFSFGKDVEKTEDGRIKEAPKPEYQSGKWTLPANTIDDLEGTLTVSPLALGTMFKRGNYDQGIRIINNKKYLPLEPITGKLALSNGTELNWDEIYGIPVLEPQSSYGTYWTQSDVSATDNWEWSQFISTVPEEGNTMTYRYDIPTVEDYEVIMKQGFGIGVLYGDGTTRTAENKETAFGYFNEDNAVYKATAGMRGFISYNLTNYNQVFFPIGYSGYGRRTIRPSNNPNPGVLRYGAQMVVLDQANNPVNQYRPIAYNNPANPGVIYWAKKMLHRKVGNNNDYLMGFDMNFFDINIGPADHAVSMLDFGDAIPIKPIVIERIQNPQAERKNEKR